MPTPLSSACLRPDARTRAAWQTQVAVARKTPDLLPFLVRQRHALLPRFAAAYQQLRALPRRVRRYLRRHWHASLGGLALMLILGQAPALAATINVTGACALVDAITSANTDTATGGCTAGSGADTLVLVPGSTHTLTTVNNTDYGANGLPVVRSAITIVGNGGTVARSGATAFRLLAVGRNGNLTVEQLTLQNGLASGADISRHGGGVFNGGTLTLSQSTLSGNAATIFGGGVYNNAGTLTLHHSLLSSNTASSGRELFNAVTGAVTLNDFNLFGVNGDAGLSGASAGATDVVPGAGVLLSNILNSTPAFNGGPTQTLNLVSGSPALNQIPPPTAPPPTSAASCAPAAAQLPVPSQSSDGGERRYHFMLTTQPKHRTAPPAFGMYFPCLSVALCESHASLPCPRPYTGPPTTT